MTVLDTKEKHKQNYCRQTKTRSNYSSELIMLYQNRQFSCPASHNTDDKTWDLAFLTEEQFMTKYSVTVEEYKELALKGIK